MMMNKLRLNPQRGFTLIELMVVVAIIAILASIAYPSYTEYIKRGRRVDAQAQVLEAAQFMQRYYAANNTFTSAVLPSGVTVSPKSGTGATAYNISVDVPAGGLTYTLTAAPTGSMTSDKCGSFTLTDTGQKGLTSNTGGTTVATCWK